MQPKKQLFVGEFVGPDVVALDLCRPEAGPHVVGARVQIEALPAIEGKTWNHPVLAGDVVLVRNGEVMAAFRLSRPAR